MCRIHSRYCINEWRVPTLAVSNVCGQEYANLHFQGMSDIKAFILAVAEVHQAS